LIAIGLTFALRMLSITFNWRTSRIGPSDQETVTPS
jgi:hypothetical protein